jgi:hypothetical protein
MLGSRSLQFDNLSVSQVFAIVGVIGVGNAVEHFLELCDERRLLFDKQGDFIGATQLDE